MSTWSFFLWFLDHWLLILWVVSVIAAYIYGGRTAALAVFTLGVAAFAYNKGKSDNNKHTQKVDQERENAYKQIDNRGTTSGNVIERLRNKSY